MVEFYIRKSNSITEDAFDIMDGQHRLFSFLKDYSKLTDDEVFEITFEMDIMPTMRERRLLYQEEIRERLLCFGIRYRVFMICLKRHITGRYTAGLEKGLGRK